jgi:hypothetical protein
MATPFETYIQTELPQRPVLLTPGNCGGYDADPNAGGAPAKIQGAPLGTFYLRVSTAQLYQKLSATPGTYVLVGGTSTTGLSDDNRRMVASVTVNDGDLACATGLASTLPGWVLVLVNGLGAKVGNGTKVAVDCYFSGDGGTTPRASGALTAGDLLYWNHTVTGFQLSATDEIDFIYNV